MPAQLARQFHDLNTYNRDFRRLRARGQLPKVESLSASLPAGTPVMPGLRLEAIDAEYCKADALAMHYQSYSDKLFALFGIMTFTMGFAYLTYDKLTHRSGLLVSYLLLLICSLGVYYGLRGRRWFAKHLSYRALAESLRVTFYLRAAGIDQSLDAAHVLALSGINRFQGFSLLTYVFSTLALPDLAMADHAAADLRCSKAVEQAWITGQHRYFVRKVAQLKRDGQRVKWLKNVLFMVIVLGIVATCLSDEWMEHYKFAFGVSVKNGVTFGEGVLALLLGAWQIRDVKMANRELLLQYRNQAGHFARARQQLSRLSHPDERNRIVLELGRYSLMESYLWTIHRYHREHEPAGKR